MYVAAKFAEGHLNDTGIQRSNFLSFTGGLAGCFNIAASSEGMLAFMEENVRDKYNRAMFMTDWMLSDIPNRYLKILFSCFVVNPITNTELSIGWNLVQL